MPSITYISHDGTTQTVSAADGTTVMQTAVNNGIPGIIAECGGAAMCATCHVYVDDTWAARIPPISDNEDAMLESAAAERRPTSRLSCQIVLSADTYGLVVHLPERQT